MDRAKWSVFSRIALPKLQGKRLYPMYRMWNRKIAARLFAMQWEGNFQHLFIDFVSKNAMKLSISLNGLRNHHFTVLILEKICSHFVTGSSYLQPVSGRLCYLGGVDWWTTVGESTLNVNLLHTLAGCMCLFFLFLYGEMILRHHRFGIINGVSGIYVEQMNS